MSGTINARKLLASGILRLEAGCSFNLFGEHFPTPAVDFVFLLKGSIRREDWPLFEACLISEEEGLEIQKRHDAEWAEWAERVGYSEWTDTYKHIRESGLASAIIEEWVKRRTEVLTKEIAELKEKLDDGTTTSTE